MNPRASILIPTHDRADTLRFAVASALRQSVSDLEVIIIGDGVSRSVREQALALTSADPRVRFFDHDKGPRHGELYRHDAILESGSDAIFYLCDDDLLMRSHVADLLALLESHNFVQSLNGWITASGGVEFYPADLASPETIAWHLRDDLHYNGVSITGTAHSRSFYLQLDDPWTTTPDDFWPDHYQARKFFRHPQFAGATSSRMTALQFPTAEDGRAYWSDERRVEELRRWAGVAESDEGQAVINALVDAAMPPRIERDSRLIVTLHDDVTRLLAHVDELRDALNAIESSRSWMLTRPLRAFRRALSR